MILSKILNYSYSYIYYKTIQTIQTIQTMKYLTIINDNGTEIELGIIDYDVAETIYNLLKKEDIKCRLSSFSKQEYSFAINSSK